MTQPLVQLTSPSRKEILEIRMNLTKPLVYLASPYSHESRKVRLQRFMEVCKVSWQMLKHDIPVLSPIAHSHPIQPESETTSFEFWRFIDQAMLERCTEMWVVQMPGWKESKGVQAEIEIAKQNGIPVRFVPGYKELMETWDYAKFMEMRDLLFLVGQNESRKEQLDIAVAPAGVWNCPTCGEANICASRAYTVQGMAFDCANCRQAVNVAGFMNE